MDSETLRANEWYKGASGVLTNLSSVLVAAAFGRWFVVGFDPFVFLWLVGGGLGLWSGLHLLTVLEADNAAG